MDRIKQVLAVFNYHEEILSKKEIIERGKIYYYHNTSKHVGDVLSRMVKSGMLERVSRGYFKINTKSRPTKKNEVQDNPDQTNMEF